MVFTKSAFHFLDLTNNVLNCVTCSSIGMHTMPMWYLISKSCYLPGLVSVNKSLESGKYYRWFGFKRPLEIM